MSRTEDPTKSPMEAQSALATFDGPTPRARLIDAFRAELLGPTEPSEVLQQSPTSRYLVGMLAPAGTVVDETEDESEEALSAEEAPDNANPAYQCLDASAIGISTLVDGRCSPVKVLASWGTYHPRAHTEDWDRAEEESSSESADAHTTRRSREQWVRQPHEAEVMIDISEPNGAGSADLGDGAMLEWRWRGLDDCRALSVFLANAREATGDGRAPDEDWLFQPELRLATIGAGIVPRATRRDEPDPDPDVASADLLYRDDHDYATGHGVAASWAPPDKSRVAEVWTEVLPSTFVPMVAHASISGAEQPSMEALASASPDDLRSLLDPLLEAYEKWIEKQSSAPLDGVGPWDRPTAEDHLALARSCLSRMTAGLRLLEEDHEALCAFNFANAVMALQMRRAALVRARRRGEPDPAPDEIAPEWRFFQIGFILQCLPGLVDANSSERSVADLLWFPTGGGKTEAYLGLSAFVIALRRLRGDVSDAMRGAGVSVIMRYTLRLLTIQQFQRALTMLCAAEVLRQQDPDTWGDERFTIGLWVGQGAAPNSFDDGAAALKKLRDGDAVFEANPYQVIFCPWCGDDLTPDDYSADAVLRRTLIRCRRGDCDFAAHRSEGGLGLPVLVVDEEIYHHPPSVLLATVDKFAQMPWNARIQALFGRVDRHCPRHGFLVPGEEHPKSHREEKGCSKAIVRETMPLEPPDLVIQDELHLISGPMGTLVGAYELAVQELCRGAEGSAGAKVIASTATIRRASRQVEALFGRDVTIFPPLGLDARDSFFSREAEPGERDRAYVAVYAPGKSLKTALVRSYAALLSRAEAEFGSDPTDAADSYMTLVGYFGSLRELGGAVRLVEDDVPARLKVLRRRGFGPQRRIYEFKELTSRVSSGDIPKRLKELERSFGSRESGQYPVDVLLASNMLSVGVDIDRLGLMVVSGQPKTTAEYIQATSRVGRRHPGLVVIVYNWLRPRDTSHYERFRGYHSTFYRHVEATSVTPFSARARDRALPAVMAAYVRLSGQGMARESAAANFRADNDAWRRLAEQMLSRVDASTGRPDDVEACTRQLAVLKSQWVDSARNASAPLVYTARGRGKDPSRRELLGPLEGSSPRAIWSAARSLREVEGEADIVLDEPQKEA